MFAIVEIAGKQFKVKVGDTLEVPKLKDNKGNSISQQIIVTFKDNEMLPQSEIDYIESRKDNEQWYRVYGLGLTGTYSDRRIYQFEIVDEIPEGAKRLPSGMDFGQSPDPTCLIDTYLNGVDLYLDEVFSENNLMPWLMNIPKMALTNISTMSIRKEPSRMTSTHC